MLKSTAKPYLYVERAEKDDSEYFEVKDAGKSVGNHIIFDDEENASLVTLENEELLSVHISDRGIKTTTYSITFSPSFETNYSEINIKENRFSSRNRINFEFVSDNGEERYSLLRPNEGAKRFNLVKESDEDIPLAKMEEKVNRFTVYKVKDIDEVVLSIIVFVRTFVTYYEDSLEEAIYEGIDSFKEDN